MTDVLLVLCGLTGLTHGAVFSLIATYLPLLLVAIHAYWTLGAARGLMFIGLAGFVGFMAEAISLNHGTLFGGNYTYRAGAGMVIAKVPLSIIVYWAVFIYIGYWLVTSSLYWLNKRKPAEGHSSLRLLAPLVIADGLAVTAMDLLMDPVSTRAGSWSWQDGGPYFGVPIGNFVGWFIITIIVTGLFRTFEYYRPLAKPRRNHSIYLLPVLGYLLVGLDFLLGAASYHLSALIVIGIVVVIVPALANITLYRRGRHIMQS
ncbi:MAG TPA: carotenoid biosynthesis protein [Candidatus Saccharimonadales bacterium]|nr:carotenoid biosynthesis protein [Candidatus Saccharimonadales bacterium]